MRAWLLSANTPDERGHLLENQREEYGQRTGHDDEYRYDCKVHGHLHRDSRSESRNQHC